MTEKFISGEELLDEVGINNEIGTNDAFIVAIVKKGDSDDTFNISQIGFTEWIEIPSSMVSEAKVVGYATDDRVTHKIALLKLNEPRDKFAKAAYKLLTQLHTVSTRSESSKGCGCIKSDDYATDKMTRSIGQMNANSLGAGLANIGIRGGIIHGKCKVRFTCYECTRCIPFTNVCWTSTCCDIVGGECEGGGSI